MKKTENKIIARIFIFGFSLIALFCVSARISSAAYLTSDQCTANGGTCNWISNNCNSDQTSVGLCQGGTFSQGACCKKTLQDTSGADPDPTGAGIGAGGTLQNPNAGLGGPAGGTVTPGTSGIPTTAASPATNPSGTNYSGALVPCGLNGAADCTLCHLVLGFKNIYDYLLWAVLLPATILVIVIAGIMYMVSSGSKGMIERAKSALVYALTAMILALLAWLIINATLSALGYTRVGNWWTYTCDTTQTTGPGTTGAGGATLPSSTAPSTPGTPGNCGGMKTTVSNQCVLASAALQSLLSCMSGKGAAGTVTSVTGSTVGGDFEKSKACCGTSNCPHAGMTCHYGCGMPDQGYSHAVDVGTGGWSDDQLLKLASIAKECGAGKIWGKQTMGDITYWPGHGTHLHISTGACGH